MSKKIASEKQKENFIDLIASITPEQLNDYIESRGKKTKGVPIAIIIKD